MNDSEQLQRERGLSAVPVKESESTNLSLKNQPLLQEILTQSNDAISVKDLHGSYLLVNKKAAELLGKAVDEIVGLHDQDFYLPEETEKRRKLDREVVESRNIHQSEELVHPGGRRMILLTKRIPLFNLQSEIFAVLAIARDVTEHRDSIQRLKNSEERLKLAQAAGDVGTWDWDLLTDSATCSPQYFQLYGLPPSSSLLSYDEWLSCVHPEDRERASQEVKQALEGSGRYHSEFRVIWPDGSVHWLSSRATVIRYNGDRATQMIGAQIDVTERKRIEEMLNRDRADLENLVAEKTRQLSESNQALLQSEAQLKALFEGIDDAVFVHDECGEIIECNEASCRRLGYPKEELIGMRTSDIDAPEFASGFESRLAVQLQRTRLRCEGVHRCKDGTLIPVDIVTSVIKFEGRDAILAVVRDLSEIKNAEEKRRELERQVQHAQKLESLGVMAGGIAHDFNNLLMGILGNVDLMLNQVSADAPEYKLAEDVRITAQRAGELCNQLLAYSGKGRIVIEPVDVNRMLLEMGNMLGISLSKKAELAYDLKNDIPAVEGDLAQLRQIIMNLITNASESLEDQSGTIIISTDTVGSIPDSQAGSLFGDNLVAGEYVVVRVTDTGKGMDQCTCERIFEPFFSTKETGRGLGLAAVLGIVRGHGGALHVSSELNVGTTFEVFLPASSLVAEEPKDTSLDKEWHPSGTILLVDDEEIVRNVARQMVEKIGFDVLVACDGLEALEIYNSRKEDIVGILLDLSMPRLSGFETLTELRRLECDVPIILSSGYSEQELTSAEIAATSVEFIQKPYKVQDLQSKLRKVLA